MKLSMKQLDILEHTMHRAAGNRFCGDSPEMQELVAAGLMRRLGSVRFCPDEYFGITNAGIEAVRGAVRP